MRKDPKHSNNNLDVWIILYDEIVITQKTKQNTDVISTSQNRVKKDIEIRISITHRLPVTKTRMLFRYYSILLEVEKLAIQTSLSLDM
jgi:hypothetical protein